MGKKVRLNRTLMEDSAMYAVIVAFPAADDVFIAGLEAGIVWKELWTGKEVIEAEVNDQLCKGIELLAKTRGYECNVDECGVEGRAKIMLKNIEHRDPAKVSEFLAEIQKL